MNFSFRWCTLQKWNRLTNIVCVILDGLGADELERSELPWISANLEMMEVCVTCVLAKEPYEWPCKVDQIIFIMEITLVKIKRPTLEYRKRQLNKAIKILPRC